MVTYKDKGTGDTEGGQHPRLNRDHDLSEGC